MLAHGVASIARIMRHSKCVVAGFGFNEESVVLVHVDFAV